MSDSLAVKNTKDQEEAVVSRIGVISAEIRTAISDALPAPHEQFFTVLVPGKVVNFAVRPSNVS